MSATSETLWIEAVGDAESAVPLPKSGVLVIGSSVAKAGMVLEGQGVADVHCAVGRTKDGGHALKDLGSEFGTLLNGKAVKSARIADGDQVAVGSRRLRIFARAAEPAAPAPPKPEPRAAAPARAAADLPTVPGYRLIRRLGRGAMGQVFLAVQQSLDREVALKLLDKKLADNADFVRRFQAEARAAAALHHSNVVTVFDVGATKDSHYLSMEYMDDGSLEDRLKSGGRVSSSEVHRILHDAASGLVFAESRGIVHRDIKPDNLMRNRQGATKIADLGLATQVEAEGEDVGTEGRKIFGTPHFISPEQVRGERADGRSDLYSLGATAYRLLSGTTPYEGSSTREILRAKLQGDPVPIEERVPDIDPGLATVVTRLIQRDPADRYPSASALLTELDRLRTAAAQSAANLASGGGSKKTGLLVGVGVGVVAVAAGLFALLGGSNGDDPDPTPGPGPTDVVDGTTDGTPSVDEAPPVDDGTDATDTGTDTDTPVGDDVAERLLEVEAENALLRLDSETLSREQRRDRLRELASTYAGTSAATTALDRADGIEAEILLEQRASADEERQVSEMLGTMRSAARLDKRPLRAGDALRAVALVPDQEAFVQYGTFVAGRDALEREIYQLAIEDLEADLRKADDAQARGDFATLSQSLAAALSRTDLPEFAEGETPPPGAQRIAELRDVLRERLDELDGLRDEYLSEQARADALALAGSLSGEDGLEGDLRRFDFQSASARVAALQAQVGSEEASEWLAELAGEVGLASQAFRILEDNWSAWKRKSVPDPRERRTVNREAVGVEAAGLRLSVDGDVQLVPWSAYAGNASALGALFRERLDREYRPDERRSIAALISLSAVVQGVMITEEMFVPNRGAKLSSREAEELLDAFADVEEWIDDAAQRERFEREQRAAQALAAGLLAASEERWTDAVAMLERFSNETPGALLVRLYSDGSALSPPAKQD